MPIRITKEPREPFAELGEREDAHMENVGKVSIEFRMGPFRELLKATNHWLPMTLA